MKTPEQMAEEWTEDNDECEFARDAFLAGYQAAQPQWISVKERLPEVGTWCLWMYPTGPEVNQYEGKLDDDTMLFHRSWYDSDDEVTHWMPLPEPPKEEK